CGGGGGPPAGARVEPQNEVLLGAERRGHPPRGVELPVVPLAVVERERVGVEALGPRDREGGGRVEAAREQDHRATTGHQTPRRAPQISTCSRGENRNPWALQASTSQGERAASSS